MTSTRTPWQAATCAGCGWYLQVARIYKGKRFCSTCEAHAALSAATLTIGA